MRFKQLRMDLTILTKGNAFGINVNEKIHVSKGKGLLVGPTPNPSNGICSSDSRSNRPPLAIQKKHSGVPIRPCWLNSTH